MPCVSEHARLRRVGGILATSRKKNVSAEIVDRDRAALLLVKPIGERRPRLLDDAQRFKPTILPASLVAWRWASLKYAGTLFDLLAQMRLGRLLHFLQNEGRDPRARIGFAVGLEPGIAVGGANNLIGNKLLVFVDHRVVVATSNQPPDTKKVRLGLLGPWRLAGQPTRHSPTSVKAAMEGVVLCPIESFIIFGVISSITETRELVVPKSMPITFTTGFTCGFDFGRLSFQRRNERVRGPPCDPLGNSSR